MLESFNDDLAVSGLLSDEKMDEVLKRHEETLKYMFLQTWTNSAWTPEEEEDAQSMLTSELLPVNDLCLFISAVTLSLMECFDLRKIMWLLDAYRHPDVNAGQRALVGVIFIFHIYRNRLSLYNDPSRESTSWMRFLHSKRMWHVSIAKCYYARKRKK